MVNELKAKFPYVSCINCGYLDSENYCHYWYCNMQIDDICPKFDSIDDADNGSKSDIQSDNIMNL